MTANFWQWFSRLFQSLEVPAPEATRRLERIEAVELHLVLPIKAAAILILVYSFQATAWIGVTLGSLEVTVNTVQTIFWIYLAVNAAVAGGLFFMRRLPLPLVQWFVFAISLVDGIFLAALTLVSGGYDSLLFWLFVILVVRNAASTPLVWSQLALNFCIVLCYVGAGVLDISVSERVGQEVASARSPLPRGRSHLVASTNAGRVVRTNGIRSVPERAPGGEEAPGALEFGAGPQPASDVKESPAETFLIRLVVLGLTAVWLYAVQVLLEKERLAAEEARESSVREGQLRSAGRLAAEIAHQIKNPLAIINNAAFSLEQGRKLGRNDSSEQVRIIQEEVERADRIITQLMGYAKLSEGHVEKLKVAEELDHALRQVFPPVAGYTTRIHGHCAPNLPPLLMQRSHLTEVLVNLLQNAREAMDGQGNVFVTARARADSAVEIEIADDGPGIPPDTCERVFEAYYTTKPKGTGLGLAIVRHNVELYGGTIHAQSELGKGARFTLVFPATTQV